MRCFRCRHFLGASRLIVWLLLRPSPCHSNDSASTSLPASAQANKYSGFSIHLPAAAAAKNFSVLRSSGVIKCVAWKNQWCEWLQTLPFRRRSIDLHCFLNTRCPLKINHVGSGPQTDEDPSSFPTVILRSSVTYSLFSTAILTHSELPRFFSTF